MNANFDYIKQHFLETVSNNISKSTYNDQLKAFGQSLFTIAPNAYENVNLLSHIELQQILDDLAKNRRQSSLNCIFQTFKNAVRFAFRKDLVTTDFEPIFRKVKAVSNLKKKQQILPSKEDIQKLKMHMAENCRTNTKLKYMTAILILAEGLRISETLSLKWKNIDFAEETILLEGEYTKNGETYTQWIGTEATNLLKQLEPYANSEFVFSTKNGTMISRTSVSTFLRQQCAEIGIQNINPHLLRKYCATSWMAEGATLADVSKQICHHKSISTTEKYILNNEKEALGRLKKLKGAM